MRRTLLSSLLLQAALATGTACAQKAQFDGDATLQASNILPPEVVSGPNHTVQQRVVNDGYLNIYVIDSPFGQLRAARRATLGTVAGPC